MEISYIDLLLSNQGKELILYRYGEILSIHIDYIPFLYLLRKTFFFSFPIILSKLFINAVKSLPIVTMGGLDPWLQTTMEQVFSFLNSRTTAKSKSWFEICWIHINHVLANTTISQFLSLNFSFSLLFIYLSIVHLD